MLNKWALNRFPQKVPVKIFILNFTHLNAKKIEEKKYKNADHLAEFALGPGISASIEQSFILLIKNITAYH